MVSQTLADELRQLLLGMSKDEQARFAELVRGQFQPAGYNENQALDIETLTSKVERMQREQPFSEATKQAAKELESRLKAHRDRRKTNTISEDGLQAQAQHRYKRELAEAELTKLQREPSKNFQAIRAKTAELQGLLAEPDWGKLFPGDESEGEGDG